MDVSSATTEMTIAIVSGVFIRSEEPALLAASRRESCAEPSIHF